ncbi:MAG: hypothetical protein M1453_07110 [Acidobacteria bacterium]|nr:hypothetical protein [Acidobacteriota bacterium]
MGEGQIPVYQIDFHRMSTEFLCARPSRLYGSARLLDLFAVFSLFNISKSRVEADCRATLSDWVMVGRDLNSAVDALENEFDETPKP